MRRAAIPALGLLFFLALLPVVAPAAAAPTGAAEPQQQHASAALPASRQQQTEVEPPDEWEDWDANGDGRVTYDEFDAIGEDGSAAMEAWVHDVLLEDYPDDQAREWGNAHLDWFTYTALDFPAPGYGEQITNAPGEAVDAGREAIGEVGTTAANSALGAVADAMGDAASDLAGFLGGELAQTGRPQLEAEWYQEHYRRMLGWAALLMLPLALAGIGSAVARGDTGQVGQTVLQVPIAYLMGLLAVTLVSAAAGLSVAMARSMVPDVEESSDTIGTTIGAILTVQPGMSQGVILLLGLGIAVAALVTLLWLVLTEAAVYAAVLFFPLAFAGRVWPATAAWGRRLLAIALALVGARVVIFALWGMVMSGLEEFTGGGIPLRSALAIMALLVLTAFAPTSALRIIPLVEGAETAPSPGAAGQRALGVGYQAMSLARSSGSLAGARRGGGGGGGRLPVTSAIAGAAPQVPSSVAAARAGRSGGNDQMTRAASGRPPGREGSTVGEGGGESGPGRNGGSSAGGGSSSAPRPRGGDRQGGRAGGEGSGGGGARPTKSGAGSSAGPTPASGGRPAQPRPTPRRSSPPPGASGGRPGPGRKRPGSE